VINNPSATSQSTNRDYRACCPQRAKSRVTDPTDYNSLVKVLGEKDMSVFQKKWEKFVLSLRAP